MAKSCDIAIIGAGPYGLSLAAHLKAAGADFRIFGRPLATWRGHMPRDMLLKSDGLASNLSAPDTNSTLKAWCAAHGIAYADRGQPVPLATFCDYASWFQKTHVPGLDVRQVTALTAGENGYTLTLDNGDGIEAARVVLATGISHFAHMPEFLAGFSPQLVSHSYEHRDFSAFAGRNLLVLGAGASAIDTAVMARKAGAMVSLLARTPVIEYPAMPDPDAVSWLSAITHPSSAIGPGWRSLLSSSAPLLFRRLPRPVRLATNADPDAAPGWFMRGKLDGQALEFLGYEVERAREHEGRMQIMARGREGQPLTVTADHVIAATGYRPDLRRLAFLDSGMREAIAQVAHAPLLSDYFETSLPGLYAVGALAEGSFGPLMRFLVGAEFVAPRLAAHLARSVQKKRPSRETASIAASAG